MNLRPALQTETRGKVNRFKQLIFRDVGPGSDWKSKFGVPDGFGFETH